MLRWNRVVVLWVNNSISIEDRVNAVSRVGNRCSVWCRQNRLNDIVEACLTLRSSRSSTRKFESMKKMLILRNLLGIFVMFERQSSIVSIVTV